MKTQTIQSPGGSASSSRRERAAVYAVAVLIVTAIGVYYLALNATSSGLDDRGLLLPYQALAGTLLESEQLQFRAIRQGLLVLEAERARTSRWLEPSEILAKGVPLFDVDPETPDAAYRWELFQQDVTVNYFGSPIDPAQPAWLLMIQEPIPGEPLDTAPNGETHHRLPDGTVLHIFVWTHRYGGQVPVAFVRQPQARGWTEIFATPPNPVLAVGR
jgi:hypothetical protein